MATDMSRVKGIKADDNEVGFYNWNLNNVEKYIDSFREDFEKANAELVEKHKEGFSDTITKSIEEALKLATSEYEVYANFSSDPDIINVELPLGETDSNSPTWQFKLSEMIASFIGDFELGEHQNYKIGEEYKPMFIELSQHLKLLASQLDSALQR